MSGLYGRGVDVVRALLAGGGLLAQVAAASAQPLPATGVGTPFELAFWQSIDSSSDAGLYEAYLSRFPGGTFGEIARARIAALRLRAPPVIIPPPASAAPPAVPVVPAPPPVVPPAAPAVAVALTAPAVVQPAPPVAQPAPAVVQPAVASVAPPVAQAQPAIAAAPPTTGADASPAAASTLGQLLAALANSQSNHGTAAPPSTNLSTAPAPAAPRTATVGFAIPAQPALSPVPTVTLPPGFCSAEARNAFHDTVYAPSVGAAKANNDAAATYLRQLQALYDQYQTGHDPDTMNAIAAAARSYEDVAQTTFAAQAALVRQFAMLMAVPVVACAQPDQPPVVAMAK